MSIFMETKKMNEMSMIKNLSLPIFRGKLKGKKWLTGAGGKIFRLMFSTYEPEQTMLFLGNIAEGNVVFDVGAHVGYYTLLSSIIVGSAGKVVAFEPDPKNNYYLGRHMIINKASNVSIVNKAVTNMKGQTCFQQGSGTGTGYVSGNGGIKVETISIDSYVEESGIAPDCIKIDIEGAEKMALEGALDTLKSKKPVIFLSTHGDKVHEDCCQFLHESGYRLEPIIGDDIRTTSEIVCYPKYK
jgi:FkbM family methyltransferase